LGEKSEGAYSPPSGQWREVSGGSGIVVVSRIKSTHETKKTQPSLSGSSTS
jgi:hypothetical protein